MPVLADHHALDREGIFNAFGMDFDAVEVKVETVGDGLYVLFGAGGNIAASIGEDGVLLVDDQFPEVMPKLLKTITELGGAGVDYAINTHWHFDHADGNMALGPAGTKLISQEKARTDMAKGGVINLVRFKYDQAAYPASALPQITFQETMHLHYNGERIDLLHFGPAHTTGDVAVIFRGHNAIHMGDVFNNTGYPFIDADSGGEIDGMILFCEAALAQINEATIVIPGHGPVTDYAHMKAYTEMLKTVRDRVSKMIDAGKSLEEVTASDPTAGFEDSFGDVSKSLGFINRVYTSLKKKRH